MLPFMPFLEKLCNKSSDIFWIRSPDFKTQVYISESYNKLWGYSISSLYLHPETWFDHIVATDKNSIQDKWNKRIAEYKPDDHYIDQYQAMHVNGEQLWVECESYPIYDTENKLEGFAGIIRDITAYANLKDELVVANQFLPKFLERVEDTVFWVRDPSLKKQLYLSPAYERIWGHSAEKLYSNPNSWHGNIIREDQNQRTAESMLQEWASKGQEASYSDTYRIQRPDGEIRWIKDVSFPIYNAEKKCIGFAGIADDITKDKLREQRLEEAKNRAEKAEAVKSEFIRNMSHDLRTPLAGIIGALNVLQDEETNPKLKELVSQSFNAADALLTTFNEILNASKLEFDEVKNEHIDFSIHDLIQEVIKLYTPVVVGKDLYLNQSIDKNLPNLVNGNRKTLHRVLLNLIGNAIKFTEKGGITIEAILTRKDKNCLDVTLNISDTGIGIPENKLEEIFLPFSRLTSSYKNSIKGSGLGLHIVNQFIQKLGGEITVKSQLGQGSTFSIHIPLQVAKKQKTTPKPQTNSQTPVTKNIHVLVVEDNMLAQRIAKANLENWGYTVETANDGFKAIEKCKHTSYELIYMDIGLPELDGLEATQIIKQDTKNSATPIVILSAHVDKELEKECLAIGIKTALEKPLTKEKAENIYQTYLSTQVSDNNITEQKTSAASKIDEEKSMVALLLERIPEEKAALSSAIEKQDIIKIRELLHSLIGAISYCDTSVLLKTAENMHKAAKENDIQKVKRFYKDFEKEITQLENK